MLVFKVLVGHIIRGDLSPPSSSSQFIQTSTVHYRLSNAKFYVLLFSHPEKIDLEKLCNNGQNVQYILYCIVSHTYLRSVSVDFLFCFVFLKCSPENIAFGQILSMEDFGPKDQYFMRLMYYQGNYLIINDVSCHMPVSQVGLGALCVCPPSSHDKTVLFLAL